LLIVVGIRPQVLGEAAHGRNVEGMIIAGALALSLAAPAQPQDHLTDSQRRARGHMDKEAEIVLAGHGGHL